MRAVKHAVTEFYDFGSVKMQSTESSLFPENNEISPHFKIINYRTINISLPHIMHIFP